MGTLTPPTAGMKTSGLVWAMTSWLQLKRVSPPQPNSQDAPGYLQGRGPGSSTTFSQWHLLSAPRGSGRGNRRPSHFAGSSRLAIPGMSRQSILISSFSLQLFPPQDVVIVLREAVGLVADILQQTQRRGMPAQFQWFSLSG